LEKKEFGEMQATVLSALVLAGTATMSAAGDDKPMDELRRFKGTWVAKSRTYDGKVESEGDLKGLTLTIDGDRFVITGEGGRVLLKGTIAVDPTATPKRVNVKMAGPDGQEKVSPAIYELKGDTLKTAFPLSGGDRPKDFSAEKGSGARVTVYQRVKE
jgi:uncharacterized protein (TIGR03067 family)